MKRILTTIILIYFPISFGLAQEIFEGPFADRITTRIAHKNTLKQLDSLSNILELKQRDKKLRKFHLSECRSENISDGSTTWTPAGNFPIISNCPGIFTYLYKQKRRGSHYEILFFYDEKGEIMDQEISYAVIVY